ncbi:anti-sigma factor [Sphaerisporangium aureirubrum]|uniref:Regulator of SigK n=1 Tax=Sphaerisporangium aureirubrum TaxID=1544736 RepID=A0ABW1NH48_9ACTN
MSHDAHTLAGAYALYAIDDPADETRFEEHLAQCAECAAEARGLRETTARIGAAVARQPSPELRSRVMAEIGQVRQLPPAVAPVPLRRPDRAPARAAWWPRLATGLAAACLVVAVGSGVVAVRIQDLLDKERASGRAVAAVLAAPDARLVSRDTPGGAATVVISRTEGRMVFYSAGLAPLPAGKTYQLWRIGPGGALPSGLTRPDAAGRTPPMVLGEVGDATTVGVTVEPDGGSAKPSGDPVVAVPLPGA